MAKQFRHCSWAPGHCLTWHSFKHGTKGREQRAWNLITASAVVQSPIITSCKSSPLHCASSGHSMGLGLMQAAKDCSHSSDATASPTVSARQCNVSVQHPKHPGLEPCKRLTRQFCVQLRPADLQLSRHSSMGRAKNSGERQATKSSCSQRPSSGSPPDWPEKSSTKLYSSTPMIPSVLASPARMPTSSRNDQAGKDAQLCA
mmetsp:Transcript_52046/g.114223  ORF Transcript_52046/g.114223 Transcript_52046/m.114223 type:complete len:202 (+) Transcript_52046:1172-1777(+)